MMKSLICFALFTGLVASVSSSSQCETPFSKCLCGLQDYYGKEQYVLNCTNQGFTNASILQHLPQKTQVLIFVGNNIPKLPRNLLGTTNNNSQLKVIDMSNNNIREILGQTFHHVPNVERLLLNHNNISIASDEHHPRVFSNFQNLLELHLTNAFMDNTPDDLAANLHDIFNSSALTKLIKLHLEENEIRNFKDPKIFCELKSILDLHLGLNNLQHINFKFDCLPSLRFIDFERNDIAEFQPEELRAFDRIAQNRELKLDFSENPLVCQNVANFYAWLQKTKVFVRRKDKLKCKPSCPKEFQKSVFISEHQKVPAESLKTTRDEGYSSGTVFTLSFALIASLSLLIYTNRVPLKTHFLPIFLSLSRKVHYTNIGKQEAQEMEV